MVELFDQAQGVRGGRKRRTIEAVAARHVDTQSVIRLTADEVAGIAETVLARHKHDGHARIDRLDGYIDSYVVLDDERGMKAAMSIEYGRADRLTEDGELVGGMDGVAPLRIAAGMAKPTKKRKRRKR